ncbi:MAG TPA: ATP-binding protein, partial [Chroococcales cyanobacterium]
WSKLRSKAQSGLSDASAVVKYLEEEQAKIHGILAKQKHQQEFNELLLQISTFLEIFLAVAYVIWFRHDITRRMQVLIDNNRRLAQRQPLAAPMSGADEIAALDGAFHRVALALTAAEENEKAMIENARDMICMVDQNLEFKQVNEASLDLIGWHPEDLLGRTLVSICPEDSRENLLNRLTASQSERLPPFESKLLRRDGRALDVSYSVTWSASDSLYFCVVHDISAVKYAERLRQEVVQMVSHDLKSPLFTVSSFLEMFGDGHFGSLTEKGKNMVQLAFGGCSQMLTLIKDLLDMEKMNAGMLEISRSVEPLQEIIEQSLGLVKGLADQKGIALYAPATDISLEVDRDRIIQVLVNLLSNAVKFSPSGETISVLSGRVPGGVEMKVVDRGRGIPASILPFIFDRFRQVSIGDSKEQGGTGLGLSIVKALVELHGGTVKVESLVDRGTTFSIFIPGDQRQ